MIDKIFKAYATIPEPARKTLRFVLAFIIVSYTLAWIALSVKNGEFSNFWAPFRFASDAVQ